MTRRRRIFSGILFAALLGAAYGGYRMLLVRDLSGEWWGPASEATDGGRIEWMAGVSLWKEDGEWRGSFLFHDPNKRWPPCAGGLALRGRYGGEYVFREHPSTCGEDGTLHVQRTRSGMRVWRKSPGTRPGGGGLLSRTTRPDLPMVRVRGTEPVIRMGQTVQGELSPPDPWSRGHGWIDTYRYVGEPGVPVVIVLRSDDFEPNLLWRMQIGGRWIEPADSGVASRPAPNELRVTVEPAGRRGAYHGFTVLTSRQHSSPFRGSTTTLGRYTLSVEPAAGPIGWVKDGLPLVRAGEPVQGALREADQAAKGHHLAYYDDYLYRGRAGEELAVEVSSDSIDPFVQIGRMRPGGQFVPLAQNDDAPGRGRDAVATVTLPDDGAYVLRTSVWWQSQGPFTLRLTRR